MCLRVKLTGLVSLVLVVLGRVTEITVDIMVLTTSFDVLKKSGLSRFSIVWKLMKATAANPVWQKQKHACNTVLKQQQFKSK